MHLPPTWGSLEAAFLLRSVDQRASELAQEEPEKVRRSTTRQEVSTVQP
jgi:hypothetical protein